ncbi:hypothetical protein [Streptomyces sp. NBC_00347]|uniref:hypothetical protein n=1 Tax=Streptomyces sp. NBC_00347 TaxID=2975721 RepID=UPI00224EDCD0|nr:hypothetical protein [Streptomyces sp. NBC_00347]MCX5125016.1 hypothetical protein [Streptomyces sp. NBC_00347]
MRKRSLAALCTATALGVVLAIPTAALAADPQPSGFKAWTDGTRVHLDFGGSKLPQHLKVNLRKPGSDAPVATVTSFESTPDEDPCSPSCDDDNDSETGIRSSPLRLADLGTYSVDVLYDGTQGEPIVHKDKATLTYGLIPRVTDLDVDGSPSLENRTVTVKGEAVGLDPRDDIERPLPNGKLILESAGASTPVFTDASGHITAPFTFAGTEKVASGSIPRVRVTLRPEQERENGPRAQSRDVQTGPRPTARITLDTALVKAPDGSKAPVSGRLTFEGADGTWKPAPAGTWVRSRDGGPAQTGADGRFATQILVNGRISGLVTLNGSAWLGNSNATVAVDPSTSAGFHGGLSATLTADRKVSLTGKLSAYDLPAPAKLKVLVEFQPSGSSEWITKATRYSAAPAGDSTRAVTAAGLPYPGPGSWRLRYVAAPGIPAGPAGISNRLDRVNTAIPEFNATPEPVKAGKPIGITGKLTHTRYYNETTWSGYGGQPVRIYFRATGATAWTLAGSTTTAADGTFKTFFTAAKDGVWQARYDQATYDHFNATSREDLVDVQ